MADLSRTILAGTEQIASGYDALTRIRAERRARRQRMTEQALEAFGTAAENFKKYQTWKEAKLNEDDAKQVDDAYTLGITTKGTEGGLTALGAVRPQTAAGSRRRIDLLKSLEDRKKDELLEKSRLAETEYTRQQTEKIKQGLEDAETERTARFGVLSKYEPDLLDPNTTQEDLEAHDLLKTGGIKASDYLRYRAIRSGENKAADVERRKKQEFDTVEARKKEEEIGRNKRAGERNKVLRDIDAGRREDFKSRLEADKTNAHNANMIRARIASMTEAYHNSLIELAKSRELRENIRLGLSSLLNKIKADRAAVSNPLWGSEDESGATRKDLLEALDDEEATYKGIWDELKQFKDSPAPQTAGANSVDLSDEDLIGRLRAKGLLPPEAPAPK